jgi:hypothetical protein
MERTRTKAVPVVAQRTRTVKPDILPAFNAKTFDIESPRYFIAGGLVYELVNQSGNMLTGKLVNDYLGLPKGKNTVKSNDARIIKEGNKLAKLLYLLLQRKDKLKNELALNELTICICALENILEFET